MDAKFINILPTWIELETILEPAIPPPRTWNIALPACNKVEMINPAPLYQMDLKSPLETRRTTNPPKRSVWFCDKVNMINPAPLYQIDLESPLEMRRMTAPPTREDLESLTTKDMMTFPHNMVDIIKEIIGQQNRCPQKILFYFKMTTEAAEKNFMVLKSHQFSLKK
jgi:hypothetical protein